MRSAAKAKSMKRAIFVFCCVGACLLAAQASAAFKFKRFPHCAEGLVTKRPANAGRKGHGIFTIVMPANIATRLMVPAINSRARLLGEEARHPGAAAPPQIISAWSLHTDAADEAISETALTCA
jgi:hypothetical protein